MNIDSSEISKIGIVIPAYKCKQHILSVLSKVPSYIQKIIVVDDKCPEQTGNYVMQNNNDPRVQVIFRNENGGVGAAVKTGYEKFLSTEIDIIVKVDGDDQMDLSLLHKMVLPIQAGHCDYTKGNRFFYPKAITRMPLIRIIGNAVLGFLTKLSSGYYSIFDPNNGYTAIRKTLLNEIEIEKVHNRYFFESDLLFRLNLARARVMDVPMHAIYGDEVSNLNELKVIPTFLIGHIKNIFKRICYSYFIRDFSVGSVLLFFGSLLFIFGLAWGFQHWYISIQTGVPATTGTVMVSVLPLVMGFQMLLSFILTDLSSEPRK